MKHLKNINELHQDTYLSALDKAETNGDWDKADNFLDFLLRSKRAKIDTILADKDRLEHYAYDDDLNSALYDLQGDIEVGSGDNASMFFSGYGSDDGYSDADEAWSAYGIDKRIRTLVNYMHDEYDNMG